MSDPASPTAEPTPWGETPAGHPVTLYTLHGGGAVRVRVMDYGGVIVGIHAPDRYGRVADVTLGHDHLGPYLSRAASPYFGAAIGRYANRIAGGRFELDGQTYTLAINAPPNALHGGPGGFDQHLWAGRAQSGADAARLTLRRLSPDGEEGYPGALDVTVTYTLQGDTLRLDYAATTDRPTVLNLTNHTYWNLSGGGRDVLDHRLSVQAGRFTPVDGSLIPTGELRDVTGTPLDLRRPTRLADVLSVPDVQLERAGGLDHNLVLDGPAGDLAPAATLDDPTSGRRLTVSTTQPGLQVYSGNFLDGSIRGKGGQVYGHRWAVCLETQHFPDSPNQPPFPPTRLNPGETFRSSTLYAFSVVGEAREVAVPAASPHRRVPEAAS